VLQDAKNCYEFLAASSPENAEKWIDSLMDAFTSLEVMPKRCPIAPESEFTRVEIRCLVYRKRYRILYSVNDSIVVIYYIRHTSQEFMSPEEF
jgi:plasmid stabilization system protein ParE